MGGKGRCEVDLILEFGMVRHIKSLIMAEIPGVDINFLRSLANALGLERGSHGEVGPVRGSFAEEVHRCFGEEAPDGQWTVSSTRMGPKRIPFAWASLREGGVERRFHVVPNGPNVCMVGEVPEGETIFSTLSTGQQKHVVELLYKAALGDAEAAERVVWYPGIVMGGKKRELRERFVAEVEGMLSLLEAACEENMVPDLIDRMEMARFERAVQGGIWTQMRLGLEGVEAGVFKKLVWHSASKF